MGKSRKDGNIHETENMFLFWSGWPSQWFPSMFPVTSFDIPHLPEVTVYSCAEMYMMAEKARLFGDKEALSAILATKSPKKQKDLGRKVKNFDAGKWNEVCRDVVYRGNLAKFQHHRDLKGLLLDTGDKIIVEASPCDGTWGIRRSPDDPLAWDQKTWNGTNWLGEALMAVRETLKTG